MILTLSISWTEQVCYSTHYTVSISYKDEILHTLSVSRPPVYTSIHLLQLVSQTTLYTFVIDVCETSTKLCTRKNVFNWQIPQTTLSTLSLETTTETSTGTTPLLLTTAEELETTTPRPTTTKYSSASLTAEKLTPHSTLTVEVSTSASSDATSTATLEPLTTSSNSNVLADASSMLFIHFYF